MMLNPNFFISTKTISKLNIFINEEENSKYTEDLIRKAYKKTINIETKKLGLCEISGNNYDENEIISYKIIGSRYINIHLLYGTIYFHKNFKYRTKYLDILFMINNNIFNNHNLQNKKVKIKRSNGNIENYNIAKDAILRFDNLNRLGINIEIKIKNDTIDGYKFIPLLDYNSFSNNKKNIGLINLNTELFNNNFVIKIYFYKSLPLWLNIELNQWILKIKNLINNHNSLIKYKFIYI